MLTTNDQPAADEGALLRLVSDVRTLVQGASVDVLKKLGTQRLTDLKTFIKREQQSASTPVQNTASLDGIAEQAERDALAMKLAANSAVPVNVEHLKAFSLRDLQGIEQAQIANAAEAKKRQEREAWASYSLNGHIDAANATGAAPAQPKVTGNDWAAYDLNAINGTAGG
ncbi:hypothetical protein [uncultured Azohydromonas sp.]|jgi:hypothetical protein|uniref:hypothetical protein n=1 Tax=uncultured Azohydromonas sp. TaxID=487342 RepID=UPI00260521B3|nr:hypothetical protein [uncultured Azohydromonas sp.]